MKLLAATVASLSLMSSFTAQAEDKIMSGSNARPMLALDDIRMVAPPLRSTRKALSASYGNALVSRHGTAASLRLPS
jgi:hypothetical protein